MQEAWEASISYGVPFDVVRSFLESWRDDEQLPERLLHLPCFEARAAGLDVRFVHARSPHAGAVPLLLLHGFSGSLVELGALTPALNDAGYDVVSPALPGFGGSSSASAPAFMDACAAVMRGLGYSRYALHGSDLGAEVALHLAASEPASVAALHVSHVPAYPGPDPFDFATLTPEEKSRLARLTELHEQLRFQLPETPVEELAFALSRLDEPELDEPRLREDLLGGLTLSCALGERSARVALYQALCLRPAPPSGAPLSVLELPLAAPSLRRFVEPNHRVVDWQRLPSGGPSPGIEQPQRLLQALTEFGERLR
jgi:pimeloyl-ACP methyl ester carboxylesterase